MSAFLLTSAATACDQAIPIPEAASPALAGIRDHFGQGYIERAFPALTEIDVLLMPLADRSSAAETRYTHAGLWPRRRWMNGALWTLKIELALYAA